LLRADGLKFFLLEVVMDFKILGKNDDSLVRDMKWEGIPEFAIITGKNGSGKTHLLNAINAGITNKKWLYNCELRSDQMVFIPYDWRLVSNVAARDLELQAKDQTRQLISCFQSKNLNHKHYQDIKRIAKRLDKIESELTEQDIVDNSPYDLDYQLASVDSWRKSFSAYSFNQEKRSHAAVKKLCMDEINKINKEKAPWELINDLFKKYGFHYRMCDFDLNTNNAAMMFWHVDKKDEKRNILQLSSGEKMIVSLIAWAHNPNTGNRVKLMLLDEPDAHLHPSMSKMMIDIIKNTLVKEYGIRVIMTTHSPSTVAHAAKKGVGIFWMQDGDIVKNKKSDEIIEDLSSGLIKVSDVAEGLQLLINETKKNVLFVEGKLDKIYLEAAIKLFGLEKKFEEKEIFIFACTGADTIVKYTDNDQFPMKKTRVALFDRDEHGEESAKNLNQKVKHLFVSEREEDKIEIERLFDEELLKKSGVLVGDKITKDEPKKLFAEEMKNLPCDDSKKEIFRKFRPLLERILEKFDEKKK